MMAEESTNTTKTPRPARRPVLVFFAVLGLLVAAAIVGRPAAAALPPEGPSGGRRAGGRAQAGGAGFARPFRRCQRHHRSARRPGGHDRIPHFRPRRRLPEIAPGGLSATTSRPGSSWPRSRPPSSTSRSARRAPTWTRRRLRSRSWSPISTWPAPTWRFRASPSTAGSTCRPRAPSPGRIWTRARPTWACARPNCAKPNRRSPPRRTPSTPTPPTCAAWKN